eukprot:6058204-Pleurochrysis_carterae.AAC.3
MSSASPSCWSCSSRMRDAPTSKVANRPSSWRSKPKSANRSSYVLSTARSWRAATSGWDEPQICGRTPKADAGALWKSARVSATACRTLSLDQLGPASTLCRRGSVWKRSSRGTSFRAVEKCLATTRLRRAGHCWSATPAKKSMSGSMASTSSEPHTCCRNNGVTHHPRPSAPATSATSESGVQANAAQHHSAGAPETAISKRSTSRSALPSRCRATSRSRTAQYASPWSSRRNHPFGGGLACLFFRRATRCGARRAALGECASRPGRRVGTLRALQAFWQACPGLTDATRTARGGTPAFACPPASDLLLATPSLAGPPPRRPGPRVGNPGASGTSVPRRTEPPPCR